MASALLSVWASRWLFGYDAHDPSPVTVYLPRIVKAEKPYRNHCAAPKNISEKPPFERWQTALGVCRCDWGAHCRCAALVAVQDVYAGPLLAGRMIDNLHQPQEIQSHWLVLTKTRAKTVPYTYNSPH